MTVRRRIVVAVAATIALLFLLLLLVPLFFRDRIEARIKTEIGRHVRAQVDWAGAGLSLLRDFPHATLRLEDITVTGTERFAGDTLVAADGFRIVLDLGSVWRAVRGDGPLVIRSIELRQPAIRLTVLEDGAASWDILRDDARADTPPASSQALELSLHSLDISDAALVFENRQAELFASLDGLQQSLTGDLSSDRFVLRTATEAERASFRFAGVPYLNDVALEVRAAIDADMQARRFTLQEGEIRLNDLLLRLAGSVAADDENLVLDLTFDSPESEFAGILSLVPAMYVGDFASLETAGTMSVTGQVRGEYGPEAFPSFVLDARVEDGMFRYPDLALPARDIAADLSITNPGGAVDSTVVRLRRFHVRIGDQPVDASLTLRTPVSDPDIEFAATGTIDLADLGRTIELENVQELAGIVSVDIAVHTRLSAVEAGAYERVEADGTVEVSDFAYSTTDLPHALRIEEARLTLSPQQAKLTALRGRIGSSDLRASGRLDNLLGFALLDQDLRGSATVHSAQFDLNEWRSQDEAREVIPVPPRVDFTLDATADRLRYGMLDLTNARGSLRIANQRITLDEFRMDLLGGSAVASGFYETTDPHRPTFDVDMHLADVDIGSAFGALTTVRMFAPVARYAQGTVSADVDLDGAMGTDMVPLFEVLNGVGSFATSELVINDFPALARLAEVLKTDWLSSPTLTALSSSFEIRGGRLHVRPFEVGIGPARMRVAGSNGIDRSLAYDLQLELPRALLGNQAESVLASFGDQASRLGIDIASAENITLGVQLGGTVTEPTVTTSLAGAAGSVTAGVEQALRDEAGRRADDVTERVDSAAARARLRAEAQAAEIIAQAEQRAEAIREEARTLAASVRREAYARADSLEARATNPAARIAARAAASRLRSEADESADRIIAEADTRATALLEEAKRRADALLKR